MSKNTLKSPYRTHFKSHHKLIMMLVVVCLSISLISSLEIDNTKSFDKEIGDYGKVTIKDWFGILDLAELELKTNTDTCYVNCEAEKEIILHQEGSLVDDVRFIGDKIISYEFYLKTGEHQVSVDDFENQCNIYTAGNGSKVNDCEQVQIASHFKTVEEWEVYELGTVMPIGTYTVKLTGEKKASDTIDWQILSQGFWITEWALWTGHDGIIAYYNFDEASGDLIDRVSGTFNGTNTATQGATGILNDAYDFPGASEFIAITSGDLGYDEFTISMWINPTWDDPGLNRLYSGSGAGSAYYLRQEDGTFEFGMTTASGLKEANWLDSPQEGVWSHIVGTYNASNITLYVNATPVANGVTDGVLTAYFITDLGRRTSGNDRFYDGLMDEVGFWNRSLTSAEVADLYNNGLALGFGINASGTISVELDRPIDNGISKGELLNFSSTATPSNTNLTNATLFLWYQNFTLFNSSTNIVLGNEVNSTNITMVGLPLASFDWNVWWCTLDDNSVTFCSYATANNSLTITTFEETGLFFDAQVYETDNSTFELNISVDTGSTVFSASLNYSNVTTVADTIEDLGSGNFRIRKTIDTADVSGNSTNLFNFFIIFDEGAGFSSSATTINSQTVSETNVTLATTNPILNFTVYDEDTLEVILSEMGITFNWFLGTGTETTNISYDEGLQSSFEFNTMPSFRNFTSEITLNLNNGSKASTNFSYGDRNYDFRSYKLNQVTRNQPLYLLGVNNGTNIIVSVKDTGFEPLEDYLVKIYRFYPEGNKFRLVESRKTDLFGQFVANLVQNKIKYRFEFFDENDVLVKTASSVIIACRSTICTASFIIGAAEDDSARFQNVTDAEYFLTFNNNTNLVGLTWNDNTDDSPIYNLLIERKLFNGTTVVYNENSSASFGLLSFDVGSTRASYSASAFRIVGDDHRRIALLNFKVGDLTDVFGIEGLMWSFILIFSFVIMGMAISPSIAIGFYMFAVFIIGITDIIYMHPGIMIAHLIIGGIAIWAMKN